jgi:hypothetical protein
VDITGLGLGSVSGSGGITLNGAASLNDASLTTTRDTLKTVLDNSRSNLTTKIGITFAAGTTNEQIANKLINDSQTARQSNGDITISVCRAHDVEPLVRNTLANVAASAYTNNTTNVQFRGVIVTEAAIGYAHRFFVNDLFWGGNFKIVSGNVGFFKQNVLQNSTDTLDPVDKFTSNTKNQVKPAIDLGVLYDKRKTWRTRLGVVAKNLNSPSFDQPDAAVSAGVTTPVTLHTQVRAGAAFYPLNFWTIATDLDLTKNLTQVNGFTSRQWSLGTEINVFNRPWLNIPLRAGLLKNISESDSKLGYTAGFGLNFLHLVVEVSGAVSSDRVNIQSDANSKKIPTNLALGATISANF